MTVLRDETIQALKNKKGRGAICAFLIENGASIQDTTNPYEVIRYKIAGSGTVVIYSRANGMLNIPDDARKHLRCFETGRAIERKQRPGKSTKEDLVDMLLERDGEDCCACGKPLGDDITLEHWVAISVGGSNALPNLGLAHSACNEAMGNEPIAEKIKIAMKLRDEIGETP